MARHRSKRDQAPPLRPAEPLILRLCTAFVDNLGIILKTAFVLGSIALAQNLLVLLEETRSTPPRAVELLRSDDTLPPVEPAKPAATAEPRESFMTEGVRRALNCTYQQYRDEHYEECVEEPSDVYRHPQPGPDERGLLDAAPGTLYAAVVDGDDARDL